MAWSLPPHSKRRKAPPSLPKGLQRSESHSERSAKKTPHPSLLGNPLTEAQHNSQRCRCVYMYIPIPTVMWSAYLRVPSACFSAGSKDSSHHEQAAETPGSHAHPSPRQLPLQPLLPRLSQVLSHVHPRDPRGRVSPPSSHHPVS